MKIIKERKPFENWNLEVECTGNGWNQNGKVPCGSLLEIDVDDLLKRNWSQSRDDTGIDYGFNCPVCGCFTPIEENKLSEHLKNMAKDYKIN